MSILDHLKIATKESHQLAEKENLAKYIIDHSITEKQYEELILKNYVTYFTIEQYLNQNKSLLDPNHQEFVNFDKSNALKKDLELSSVDVRAIQYPDHNLSSNSNALIGALYVIEGSMLGGLLIAKNLQYCKNLSNDRTHHFFGGNPKNHVSRWKNFCSTMNEYIYSEDDLTIAKNTAINVFKIFY